jgi:hypothetical protein
MLKWYYPRSRAVSFRDRTAERGLPSSGAYSDLSDGAFVYEEVEAGCSRICVLMLTSPRADAEILRWETPSLTCAE